MVSDAVVGICGNVVKELVDGVVGGFRGGGLLLDQFAENYQYFFVGGTTVVKWCSHNRLDADDAAVV